MKSATRSPSSSSSTPPPPLPAADPHPVKLSRRDRRILCSSTQDACPLPSLHTFSLSGRKKRAFDREIGCAALLRLSLCQASPLCISLLSFTSLVEHEAAEMMKLNLSSTCPARVVRKFEIKRTSFAWMSLPSSCVFVFSARHSAPLFSLNHHPPSLLLLTPTEG